MAGNTTNKKSETKKITSKQTTKKVPSKTNASKTNTKNTANQNQTSSVTLERARQRNQVNALILFATAILTGCMVVIEGENLWAFFHNILMGLFSGWAIMWPLLMIYVAVVISLEKPQGTISGKIWLTAIVIVFICTTVFLFQENTLEEELGFIEFIKYNYQNGVEGTGSGLIGALIGTPLIMAVGLVGARIIMVLLLFVALMIMTGTTLIQLYRHMKKPVEAVSTEIHKVKVRHEEEKKLIEENALINKELEGQLPIHPVLSPVEESKDQSSKEQRAKKKKESSKKLEALNKVFGIGEKSDPYTPVSPVIRYDDDKKETVFPEIPTVFDRQSQDVLVNKEDISEESKEECEDNSHVVSPFIGGLVESKHPKIVENFDVPQPEEFINDQEIKISEDISSDIPKATNPISSSVVTPVDVTTDVLQNATKAAEEYMKKKEEDAKKEIASTAQMALYEQITNRENSYIFPPVTMLAQSKKLDATIETEELQTNGQKLVDTLNSFGVKTDIKDICRGPSVTRYELQPRPGVKISKITSLSDDIALNLAATGVRIEAPIPGKAAVGIEVPNKNKSVVRMRELVESNPFITSKSRLTVVLGRDIAGQVTVADLGKMPHMLIAGTTGSGKSVCINSLIVSLLYKSSPEDVRFLMIDPKVVELGVYNGIPHLLVPVVTDPRKAAGALNWAVTEMLNRYKIFADFNVKDLQGYNHLAAVNEYKDENGQPMLKMPQIVIIIDELADLMMAAPNDVEDAICRLAQMARAAGMHLVVATQRPTVDVVTGLIKANIPSRIAFAVSSTIDSRTILDSVGAEKLLGQGDMLFSPVGAQKPTRIQGCFVSEKEIESIIDFVKKSKSADYDEEIIQNIEKNAVLENTKGKKDDQGTKNDMDPVMEDAIKCVIEAGQASTSLLQRRLRLGYARAGRLIDEMEQMGIVGPHEGSKPRQVLMSYAQWAERNMQKSDSPTEENDAQE